jgi:hypothetical protein
LLIQEVLLNVHHATHPVEEYQIKKDQLANDLHGKYHVIANDTKSIYMTRLTSVIKCRGIVSTVHPAEVVMTIHRQQTCCQKMAGCKFLCFS